MGGRAAGGGGSGRSGVVEILSVALSRQEGAIEGRKRGVAGCVEVK